MKHNLVAVIDKHSYNLQLRMLRIKDFERKVVDVFLNSLCNKIESINMLLNPMTDDIPCLVDSVFAEWNSTTKELELYIDKFDGGDYEIKIPIQQLHNHYRNVASLLRQKIKTL